MSVVSNTIRYVGVGALILVGLLVILAIYVYATSPALPANANTIIDSVMGLALPERVQGQAGYVTSGGYQIWYEAIQPASKVKGTILLCSGSATDALMWPQAFIDAFTDAGYQVIRFDYRGVGNSDWVLNWKEETYSISDLAKDAAVILDTLKVQEVHIVGMSLGGMVAEEFALRNPERVLTLTTLMSSSNIYDPNLPKASGQVVADFTKIGLKYGLMPSEKNAVKMMLAAQVILRGDAQYNLDVREVTEQVLYNLRERKGFNPEAGKQHDQAARLWGDHDEELKMLDIPALIIHGKNDPFVSSDHSEKLASLLPNAKSKWFFNMGHDLPPDLIGELTKTIMHFYETTAYERAK